MYSLEVVTFVHKFKNGYLPNIFDNFFVTFQHTHQIGTRNSENRMILSRFNNNQGKTQIKVIGVKLWNDLKDKLRNIENKKAFRKNVRNMYLPYN